MVGGGHFWKIQQEMADISFCREKEAETIQQAPLSSSRAQRKGNICRPLRTIHADCTNRNPAIVSVYVINGLLRIIPNGMQDSPPFPHNDLPRKQTYCDVSPHHRHD
ncbi:hypothetical protein TNCV_2849081 [Trichonephila clavipes]|nr:hypothetical protein TNCV_2849081 [Trichonephila clavipes]